MANYININGNNIPIRASDPSNPIIGEVWYNLTTNQLKGQGATTTGSFSTGGSMSNARAQVNGGIGTKDATIAAGLTVDDGTSEEYNGTAWSGGGSLNNAGVVGTGAGTLSAGSRFGGIQPTPLGKDSNYHEQYDGTSWTTATAMPFDSYNNACGGTQTANIVIQSFFNPTPSTTGFPTATAEWNGSWTSGGSINTARREAFSSQGGGTQISCFLAGGGAPGSPKNNSETYDGTSWTSTANMNTARSRGGGGGTATNGIIITGTTSDPQIPGLTTATESWNGTSWTTNSFSVSTATWNGGSAVTSDESGIIFGGNYAPGAAFAGSEELSGPGLPVTVTFSSS